MAEPTVTSASVPVPNDSVAGIDVKDEMVLLDESTGSLLALDPLGALMWKCFDGTATIGEIAVDVADVFGVSETVATDDLVTFVEGLVWRGLLRNGAGAHDESVEADHVESERFLQNPPNP